MAVMKIKKQKTQKRVSSKENFENFKFEFKFENCKNCLEVTQIEDKMSNLESLS